MTLVAGLRALPPAHVLYRFLDADGEVASSWTAGALLAAAEGLAGALSRASERVLLCTGPGREQPLGLFAVWLAGRTAVPAYPPTDRAALHAVLASSGCTTILTTPDRVAALQDLAPDVRVVATDASGPLVNAPTADQALVLYTSGSTSAPKGAVLRHAALWHNMRAVVQAAGPGRLDRIATWLPEAHVAGLYTRLLAVAAGIDAVVMTPEQFMRDPVSWLRAIERYQASFGAAPDFAYALLAKLPAADLDLSRWTTLVSGGERVRASTLDAFTARYGCTGWAPYYGMTETLCTSIPLAAPLVRLQTGAHALAHGRLGRPQDHEDIVELVGNGPVVGDTEVAVVDPDRGFRCMDGRVGELWLRGTSITPGYLGGDDGFGQLDDRSWFRTGDLGLVHDGQVYITGRSKEVLIVRGKNHHPPDLEATTERVCPGAVVAAFTVLQEGDEALGLAVELPEGVVPSVFVRDARRAIASQHGLAIAALYLLDPGELPRTRSNKLSRAATRACAEAGNWVAASEARRRESTAPSTQATLQHLEGDALRKALLEHLPELQPHASPVRDLGLDSLALASLAARIRTLTGHDVPFERLFDGTTGAELASLVAGESERAVVGAADWREVVRKVAVDLPDRLPTPRPPGGDVFLTGATGFLGRFLLHELLARTTGTIRCLVRASSDDAARQRLLDALVAGPGLPEDVSRIEALRGDITADRFGLDETTWAGLQARTAVVLHNAANVDFVAPYQRLRPVNVDPIHTLLRLCVGAEGIPIHLVSTLAVFNTGHRREERVVRGIDRHLEPGGLYSGYAQTKWVAEAAFHTAGGRGLPVGIHRPGLITGAFATGVSAPEDFLCRLIVGCIQLGAYPDVDLHLDLMAVDDVAASIVAAVQRPVHGVEATMWSYDQPTGLREVMRVFVDRGHVMRPLPLQDWLTRIRTDLPADNALFPVHPFLFERPPNCEETLLEKMDGVPLVVDASEAETLRTHANLPNRRIDAAAIHRMAAWLESQELIP